MKLEYDNPGYRVARGNTILQNYLLFVTSKWLPHSLNGTAKLNLRALSRFIAPCPSLPP